MNFDEATNYLLGLGHETLAMKLGLAAIARLLEALGNPQHDFAAVQIAGTNGKGSTAIVLDAICRAANIDTGLYTSPHLVSITERIKINGRQITPDNFARPTTLVRQSTETLVQDGQLEALPTFFEHVTAIALLAFREARVQLAILETGLGGRLDATTVAGARTVALTPIAMDHQEYLGETLAEIASEKAAIIRPDTNVIIGPQLPEAMAVILRQCDAAGVTPRLVESDGTVIGADERGRFRVNFKSPRYSYHNVQLDLPGRHQITNAAVAIALAETLSDQGFAISREAIIEGVESARHAARIEFYAGRPRILLDGAHNPAAARALHAYLDEFVEAPVTLVFGGMRDKNLREMLATLLPAADQVILTTFANARAANAETLLREMPGDFPSAKVTVAASAGEALRKALEQTAAEGVVCVTGSLYLVGEIQKLLAPAKNKV
ncbi:MAG TPA: folylpolyglutamate synthase/dihydrofolate synthase family protein [Pyrinomonadaceae bacterium]